MKHWRRIGVAMVGLLILLPAFSRADESTGEAASATVMVALLQMDAAGDDQEANGEKAERFCREAAARGADIALMPELWNIGYTRFDEKTTGAREAFVSQAVAKKSDWVRRFARLARELDMAIAVTYEQAWEGAPRNAVTLFDRRGREVFTYAKVHTCDFAPMEAALTPGERFFVRTLETKAGPVRVGAMICFDREQPESARILMLNGAELILTPNACTLEELRLDQFKIRAWENAVGVAMANYAKPDQNGHSVAYDAEGKCLVEAGEEEGVFLATFTLDRLRERRAKTIWGNAYRRPHRYRRLLSREKEEVWRRKAVDGRPYESGGR